MKPTIYIGADHAGFHLKEVLKEQLHATGYPIEDLGAYELNPQDDYPHFGKEVAEAVRNHKGSLGILSCGNAEGICIAANKIQDIRAGVGYSVEAAATMRKDDNANIICIPGRTNIKDDPIAIAQTFLQTPFSNLPRHVRRLNALHAIDHKHTQLPTIVPTLLVKNAASFEKRVHHAGLRQIAPLWQIDIQNETLTSHVSWADPARIKDMEPLPFFELHLMVDDPLPIIKAFHQHVPTTRRAIIHAEIPHTLPPLISQIHEMGMEAGVALEPDTPITHHKQAIQMADMILIMGVYPGSSGQSFLGRRVIKKIRRARRHFPHIPIAVDGSADQETAPALLEAGATQLCVGSGIWKEPDPVEAYRSLQHTKPAKKSYLRNTFAKLKSVL